MLPSDFGAVLNELRSPSSNSAATVQERQAAEAEEPRQKEAQKRPQENRIGHTERYLDNGDGTVTDPETGLQWMRCSLGQTWNGGNCLGEAQSYTWDEAMTSADELNQGGGYAGYRDWRMPPTATWCVPYYFGTITRWI